MERGPLDVGALQARLELLEESHATSFAALRQQIDDLQRSFQVHATKLQVERQLLRELLKHAAVAEDGRDALAALARRAREVAVFPEAAADFSEAAALLAEPLEAPTIARAYDLACKARGGGGAAWHRADVEAGAAAGRGEGTAEERGKLVLRIIRDLLVLKVCLRGGPWDNARLEHTMEEVFGRPVDNQLMSLLLHSFNTLIRMGQDRAEFARAVGKAYGGLFPHEIVDGLFAACGSLAAASAGHISNNKAGGKRRRTKGRTQGPAQSSSDHTTRGSSAADEPGDTLRVTEAGSHPSTGVDEPRKVAVPSERYQFLAGHVVVTNPTKLNVFDMQSSCPSAGNSMAWTCPQLRGASDEQRWRGSESSKDALTVADDAEVRTPAQRLELQRCERCGADDPDAPAAPTPAADDSDLAHAFRRVSFAIREPKDERAFREEFAPFIEEGPAATAGTGPAPTTP